MVIFCNRFNARTLRFASLGFAGLLFLLSVSPSMAQTDRQSTGSIPSAVYNSPAPGPSTEPFPAPENPDLRLALAKVSLDAETGKFDDARAILDRLKTQYPQNPQVLSAEADLDFRIGNTASAFSLLDKAMILDPNNEDIIRRQQAEMMAQGPFASIGYDLRRTPQAYENMESLVDHASLAPDLRADLNLENDHLNTRVPIMLVNGSSQGFYGNRQQATLALDKTMDNGDEATASLYGENDTAGAGAKYRWWDNHGVTSVEGNLYRPYWDYVESVVEHGTKSNILFERKQVFTPEISATLDGGFNHYELRNDDDAADSGGWNLNLDFDHPIQIFDAADQVTFGAYYTVDAEYFTDINSKTASSGSFNPLPAYPYEIHSFSLSLSKEFLTALTAEGFGGYGVDRIGGSSGPLYGFLINYAPLNYLNIQAHGSHTSLSGISNNERDDNLGINVKWLW